MGPRFAHSARRFLDAQPHNVRSKLINDALWLHENHYLAPDYSPITPFLAPPVVMKLFRDDFHVDGESLIIANIGHNSEAPHLWRSAES